MKWLIVLNVWFDVMKRDVIVDALYPNLNSALIKYFCPLKFGEAPMPLMYDVIFLVDQYISIFVFFVKKHICSS